MNDTVHSAARSRPNGWDAFDQLVLEKVAGGSACSFDDLVQLVPGGVRPHLIRRALQVLTDRGLVAWHRAQEMYEATAAGRALLEAAARAGA